MPYLKSSVVDLGLPDFVNHLIPLVEASLQTPVANTFSSGTVTTGTINPGVIYVGNTYQVGVEAMIPINRQSGTSVGVDRPAALLPRRHFPRQHRQADLQQFHRIREAGQRQMIMHKLITATAVVALLFTARAHAHAHLDRASPAVGSDGRHCAENGDAVVHRIAGACLFHDRSAQRARRCVQAGKATVDPANHTELRVALKPLPPGTYKVIWRVLSVDTHRTQGDFTFSVGR